MAQGYTGQGIPDTGEGHITFFGNSFYDDVKGVWALLSDTSYIMFSYLSNTTTHAVNDQIDYYIWLSKGTYTLSVMGATTSNSGIATYLLDDVSQGTLDWYSAGTVQGVLKTIASLVVTKSKNYKFSIKMATTNGSSGDYYHYMASFAFFRTA